MKCRVRKKNPDYRHGMEESGFLLCILHLLHFRIALTADP
jgi:hypothetical protein